MFNVSIYSLALRANDLAMLYVMFNKPSLVESLVVVAGAAAVFTGIENVREQRPVVRVTSAPRKA